MRCRSRRSTLRQARRGHGRACPCLSIPICHVVAAAAAGESSVCCYFCRCVVIVCMYTFSEQFDRMNVDIRIRARRRLLSSWLGGRVPHLLQVPHEESTSLRVGVRVLEIKEARCNCEGNVTAICNVGEVSPYMHIQATILSDLDLSMYLGHTCAYLPRGTISHRLRRGCSGRRMA